MIDMANTKTGLSYYTVDCDRYQDRRIKRLKKDFNCIGPAVYDYIQKKWQKTVCFNEEYKYVVCRSFDDFKREVDEYLRNV